MRWITLLLALLLAPGFELAAKAGDQQTGETARTAENAMRERRDNQKTIAEETEIIRLDGGEAEESCRTVWSAASQGDLPRTISAFGEFQAACANCTTAYLHRARCYQADGEWDKTIADCTAILRIDLRNAAAYSMRGAAAATSASTTRRWPTATRPWRSIPTAPTLTSTEATSSCKSTNSTRRWPTATKACGSTPNSPKATSYAASSGRTRASSTRPSATGRKPSRSRLTIGSSSTTSASALGKRPRSRIGWRQGRKRRAICKRRRPAVERRRR